MRILFSMLTLLACPLVFAAVHCDTIMQDMEKMRQAQQAVLISLANNHEMMASTMEETTMELELYSKKVPAKALKGMSKTAQAFRARGLKGKQQAEQLNEATADLMANVAACLKK